MISKAKYLIFVLLLVFTNIKATELSKEQKQRVRNVVSEYTKLLTRFNKTENFKDRQSLLSLFYDDDILVYNDLAQKHYDVGIHFYLSALRTNNVNISFPAITSYTNVESVMGNGLFGIVKINKQVSGRTVTNIFYVDTKNYKITNIFDKLPISSYNLTPAQMYQKAMELIQVKNYAEANKWFKKAADSGNRDAMKYLASSYYMGVHNNVNNSKALYYYRLAANKGDGDACHILGYFYETGYANIVSKNGYEALKWYKKAAEKNIAESQYTLGQLYSFGDIVTQNYSTALKWYKKAALQNFAPAETTIGIMYMNGEGVKQSYSQAVYWYKKAASPKEKIDYEMLEFINKNKFLRSNSKDLLWLWFGDAQAQHNLSIMYKNGTGVSQNYYEAFKWSKKSAEQGYIPGQINLAAAYYKGNGVEKDTEQAVKWWRKAANQGSQHAKDILQQLGY